MPPRPQRIGKERTDTAMRRIPEQNGLTRIFRRLVPGAAALLAAGLLAVPPAQAQGNKALMEEWTRQKRQAREEVYQELKRQGAVPRNGTITFEATVKPDPRKPGQSMVRIDSVVVNEGASDRKAPPTDPVFGPRDPGGPRHDSGSIDVGRVRESIRVVDGVPQF